MTITESEVYTRKLLKQHLPKDWQNWKVEFYYSLKFGGRIYFYRKSIVISLWAIQYATTDDVIEIIKHEVAHAIAFTRFKCTSHNHIWENVCKYVVKGNPELGRGINRRI